MTAECLVCYAPVNKTLYPGLQLQCGHWHCEACTNLLAEHCSICHRGVLNLEDPCSSCSRPVKMFEIRVCENEACGRFCCQYCSVAQHCCSFGDDRTCTHSVCSRCAESERDSAPAEGQRD
jgi:hypothetical protein